MRKQLCITIDLESDFAGIVPESYESCDVEGLHPFFEFVKKYDVKLTVFVVGRVLEMKLPIIKELEELGAEFALHSYSHDIICPDNSAEIARGKKAFKKYFGVYPEGYRAPQGRISREGMHRLEMEGFKYDASVFPSFWPSIKYFFYPRHPYMPKGNTIVEFPFATFPFGLIISLSWIKLLGWPLFRFFLSIFPPPKIFVFDSHFHDYNPSDASYNKLSLLWKFIYGRNYKKGIPLFEKFFQYMKKKGYESTRISEVYDSYRNQ
jgi:hypothetical protein